MPAVHRCSPVFAVADPPRMAKYYADVLGFAIVGGAAAEYAIVARGGFEIHFHLAGHTAAANVDPDAYRGGAYFVVNVVTPSHSASGGSARNASVLSRYIRLR